MRKLLLSSFALVIVSASVPGCSNAESLFCTNMRKHYGESMNDCETDALPEIKAQCKEPDKVFECIADAKDKAAAEACEAKCEKK
jgi:hypothetical protein